MLVVPHYFLKLCELFLFFNFHPILKYYQNFKSYQLITKSVILNIPIPDSIEKHQTRPLAQANIDIKNPSTLFISSSGILRMIH